MKEKKNKNKKKKPLLRFLESIVRLFYKKREFVGTENFPDEACIFIGNHSQAHAPLTCELYFPLKKRIWCVGQLMEYKEIPNHAYNDFWGGKPKWCRWFYKLLAYLITPLAHYIFTNTDTLPVYRDMRIVKTFKKTVETLKEGENVVIFPESHVKYNEIVNEFHDRFIDCAKLYYANTKKRVAFVPMYNAPELKTVIFGKPIYYSPEIPLEEQRTIICGYLKNEITALAKSLPVHTVVPFDNVPKNEYRKSREQ